MAHWLLKTEPTKYAFADLERDGATIWDGVRNAQAAIFLRTMRLGEEVFIYHSQEGLEVVGIARITREAFADPSDETHRYVAVEIAPVRRLARPVPLSLMRATAALGEMRMFRQFRLSVSPVTDEEWAVILGLAGD
jgi:predicted RNA-binding protein with PUA-like domain